ncbi:MAG: hypothetical protein R3C19_10320 [Planctomycetaceae bacterium]
MRRMFLALAAMTGLSLIQTPASADDGDSGFAAVQWTLNQLTKLDVGDDGQLQLKRDHWEVAAKRPLPKPPQPKLPGGLGLAGGAVLTPPQRNPFADQEVSPLEQLFERMALESGGYRSGSRSGIGDRVTRSWTSAMLDGRLTTEGDDLKLELSELAGSQRSFRLAIDGRRVRLLFRRASDFVQVLRNGDVVLVCSSIDGDTKSLAGSSFARLVQDNEDYFRDDLQPLLTDVTQLPIDQAVALNLPREDALPEFPPVSFEDGPLTEGDVGRAFRAVVRFCIVDGRLRINRFAGDQRLLKQEIEVVSREFQESLDRAIERLREQDVPESVIDALKSKMGGWQDRDVVAVPVGGNPFGNVQNPAFGFGRARLDPFPQEAFSDPLVTAFQRLQEAAGPGGRGASLGGDDYALHFSSGEISAALSRRQATTTFQASDSAVRIEVRERLTGTELQIESDTAQLIISQHVGQPWTILLLGGGQCEHLVGESLAALIHRHEDAFRTRILPVLTRYGISGLDPLSDKYTTAVLRHLQNELPDKVDIENVVSETDAYVLPLLNDVAYLLVLAKRLEGDDPHWSKNGCGSSCNKVGGSHMVSYRDRNSVRQGET